MLRHFGTIAAVFALSFASIAEAEEPQPRTTIAQNPEMQVPGCCMLQNGTNGWDTSDNVTREQCVRSARQANLAVDQWFHYPNETCVAVQRRCGTPNPC